jgi:HK97 family phage portal protein
MGILRALRKPPEERGYQNWWNLAGAPGFISAAAYGGGVDSALRNAATWACIDVLSDAISRTPLDAIRGTGASRQPVTPQPALLVNPSGVVQRDVWRSQLAYSLLTDGNGFGRIMDLGRFVYPNRIELLNPMQVSERQVVDGVPQVRIDQDKPERLWPHGDIWHIPGRMVPAGSPFGLSPIEYASKVIGTSLAAEDFSFRFFEGGGGATMGIFSDVELDADQAAAIKAAWRRSVEGGSREPIVWGSGLRPEKLTLDPNETQFIDLMRFEVEQVCRFWHVPPSMVFAAISGQNVTYTNITDADLQYLKHSLDGYLVRIEMALSDLLPKPQIVRANRNAVLRSDAKSRFDVYAIAVPLGLMSRNEVRALEDQPPIPGGDEYANPAEPPTVVQPVTANGNGKQPVAVAN